MFTRSLWNCAGPWALMATRMSVEEGGLDSTAGIPGTSDAQRIERRGPND